MSIKRKYCFPFFFFYVENAISIYIYHYVVTVHKTDEFRVDYKTVYFNWICASSTLADTRYVYLTRMYMYIYTYMRKLSLSQIGAFV